MPTSPPPVIEESSDIVGQMAGEYRLRRKLGEGGYGAVYEAEHPVLKRRAAVKVLHRAAGNDSEAVRRFISEAQAATQIRSRHIVDIFSFGTLRDGRCFYVMDLLEGETLERFIIREKRLDVVAALQLLRPLAAALDAAHAVDIVHRDLKPQNVFLVWGPNGDTVPKLLDFGTAKLLNQSPVQTMSGTVIGTPLYMSPEQVLGQPVDARADIYALGLLCHELLTGSPPITGSSAIAVLAGHLAQKPDPVSSAGAGIPAELDAPLLRMLEKDANQRPAHAGQAIDDLVGAAERAGLLIPPGMPRLPKPPPRELSELERAPSLSPLEPGWHEQRSSERGLQRDAASPLTRTLRARRHWWGPWLAAAVALAGAVGLWWTGRGRDAASRESAVATLVAAEVTPAPPSSSAPPPAPPSSVEVTVHGAPEGAHITMDGKRLADAPGPVSLAFGDSAVQLTISAPGYEPAQLFVIPNQRSTANVNLRKRASSSPAVRERIPSDLENPF